MNFTFTEKYKFTTLLKLNTETLGIIITEDIKWDENTEYLVKNETPEWSFLGRLPASLPQLMTTKLYTYMLEASLSSLVKYGIAALPKKIMSN